MPPVPNLGTDYICRREVFDVLAAAGEPLAFSELVKNVVPRLRKLVLKEIQNEGQDTYLRIRLERFRTASADGHFGPMIVMDNGSDLHVSLVEGFVMKAVWPDGEVKPYQAGLAAKLDLLSDIDRLIVHKRDGLFNGIAPAVSPQTLDALRESMKRQGFLAESAVRLDRTGGVIDGRARRQIAAELGIQPILETTDLTPVEGLVRSLDLNLGRITASARTKAETQMGQFGIEWPQLLAYLRDTRRWRRTPAAKYRPSDLPEHSVTITVDHKPVSMSTDGEWIHLRSLCTAAGAPAYYASKLKDRLNGVRSFSTREVAGAPSLWVQTDEFLEEFDSPVGLNKMDKNDAKLRGVAPQVREHRPGRIHELAAPA